MAKTTYWRRHCSWDLEDGVEPRCVMDNPCFCGCHWASPQWAHLTLGLLIQTHWSGLITGGGGAWRTWHPHSKRKHIQGRWSWLSFSFETGVRKKSSLGEVCLSLVLLITLGPMTQDSDPVNTLVREAGDTYTRLPSLSLCVCVCFSIKICYSGLSLLNELVWKNVF